MQIKLTHTLMLGALLFIVGTYFVLPVAFAAFAVAYRQVFPPLMPADADFTDEPEPEEPVRPALATGPASTDVQSDVPHRPAAETGINPGPPPE